MGTAKRVPRITLKVSVLSAAAMQWFERSLPFAFGLTNLMFGEIVRFSSARTPFTRLASPAAPSQCPTFGLIDPM